MRETTGNMLASRRILIAFAVWSAGPAAVSPALAGTGASFQGLGDLPGASFDSMAFAVSADGSTVVGRGLVPAGFEAFRWTQAGGMVGLGDLPGGSFRSDAFGVSADGSVVVGASPSAFSVPEAFRWTQAGGMVALGDLPGGSFQSTANGVSADGSIVVGESHSTGNTREAFAWTAAGG
ncbi:MAG: PEP-CTERM sorting domain-containing protein, partial [Planctomycetota bacterium]|nr:PEP-CTERM sorting domain-containing protein [Planctomycetota bacterium]